MSRGRGESTVRLTVPAAPNYVQVVRVAVRVVAGRAGCSDDGRTRIQAATGAAFFELVDRAGPGGVVQAVLTSEPDRMVVELSSPDVRSPDPTSVAGVADGHAVDEESHALRVWVSCGTPPT